MSDTKTIVTWESKNAVPARRWLAQYRVPFANHDKETEHTGFPSPKAIDPDHAEPKGQPDRFGFLPIHCYGETEAEATGKLEAFWSDWFKRREERRVEAASRTAKRKQEDVS